MTDTNDLRSDLAEERVRRVTQDALDRQGIPIDSERGRNFIRDIGIIDAQLDAAGQLQRTPDVPPDRRGAAAINIFNAFADFFENIDILGASVEEFGIGLADALAPIQEIARNLAEDFRRATERLQRFFDNLTPRVPNPWLADIFGDSLLGRDPLVFDLNGGGAQLTSLRGSEVFFDLDNNGFAERTGWVRAGDGLLALDVNGNGRIDNGSELFGTATTDGFTILSQYDSNGDNQITSADAIWDRLLIWRDEKQVNDRPKRFCRWRRKAAMWRQYRRQFERVGQYRRERLPTMRAFCTMPC